MNRNNYFQKIVCISFFFFILLQVSGQVENKTFSAYAKFIVSDALDISWKKPQGFYDLKTSTSYKPDVQCSAGFWYQCMLQSNDGGCLILYPAVDLLAPVKPYEIARVQMISEVYATAIGIDDELLHGTQNHPTLDFNKYVTTLTKNEASRAFNADTVFIARLLLKKPYQKTYPYCTGVYVQKKGRPTMLFKCFFTEAGKQKEKEYLRKLYKGVKYRNKNWQYDKEKLNKAYKRYLNYKVLSSL